MQDVLAIIDVEIWTRIGVPKEERDTEQRLLVSVEMELDTRTAAKVDDVKKSINYADVTEDLKALAQKERKTIERFAEDVARMILKKYKTETVAVTVKKFSIPGTKEISLVIQR